MVAVEEGEEAAGVGAHLLDVELAVAVGVGPLEPFDDRIGVLLVGHERLAARADEQVHVVRQGVLGGQGRGGQGGGGEAGEEQGFVFHA